MPRPRVASLLQAEHGQITDDMPLEVRLRARIDYLLDKVAEREATIVDCEQAILLLKAVVRTQDAKLASKDSEIARLNERLRRRPVVTGKAESPKGKGGDRETAHTATGQEACPTPGAYGAPRA